MNLHIRQEQEQDHYEVEALTRDAFWDLYQPGCDEHFIVHRIRNQASFIPELDLVAEADGKIVGNIMYTKGSIKDGETAYDVLSLGPVSVLPDYQKKGIGSELIRRTLKLATDMGHRGVILFGSPKYYPRFGFRNAAEYGITTDDGKNFDAFMALELVPGALKEVKGAFHSDPVFFNIDKAELEEFEKQFPAREKHVTDTQF